MTNNGGTPLTLTSITISGAQAADFAFAAGNTCLTGAGSVVRGASGTIIISFTPAATGARTATVTITDDAASSPQSVSLAGTGIVPAVTLAPTNLAFGDQRLSTTSPVQTVTLTNSGTATLSITSIALTRFNPGDFAIAAGTTCTNGATVVAGASCLLNLTFTPTAASARTFFFNDTATTEIYTLSLHDALPIFVPAVTLAPTNLAFGDQRLSTTSPVQTVTLTNSGTATLSITSIALTRFNPGDFAIAAGTTCTNGATVVAGASCLLNLTFTPTAASARTFFFNDTATTEIYTLSLHDALPIFVPAVTLAPTNLAFGDQRLSTTSPVQTVTLTNSGTATLSITSIVLAGSNPGDFAIAAGTTCTNGATVVAGASCLVNLTFTPTAASARTATVTITDDAPGSPQSVSLTGTGVTPPAATLSATSSAFGNQRVGTTSAAQNLTLTNNGGAPLNLTSITITGAQAADFAFAAGNTCPTGAGSVAPGASCTISISFTPAATGARAATVTITDDAAGSPQLVSLAGTGIVPAVTLAPTNLAFGTQRLSTTSPAQTVTLTNSGTATLSITSIALAGSNPGDFAVAGSGVAPCPLADGPVAASASCAFTVTFTPAATGARTATVTITDDAPGSPQSVSLAGTGIVFFF